MQEKTEKAQQSWAKKQQGLQYEANQLTEKYQKGLITSFDAQKQQEALQRRAANLESSVQKEGQTLEEENFVFVNAWNEWAEGNHLEPDLKWGGEYLAATQRAIEEDER